MQLTLTSSGVRRIQQSDVLTLFHSLRNRRHSRPRSHPVSDNLFNPLYIRHSQCGKCTWRQASIITWELERAAGIVIPQMSSLADLAGETQTTHTLNLFYGYSFKWIMAQCHAFWIA